MRDAPDTVKRVFDVWSEMPEIEFVPLTNEDLEEQLSGLGLELSALSIQVKSDLLRTKLLKDQPAVWVDATALPTRPIADWLPAALRPSEFFAFAAPGPDRPISSWFLATGVANHPILDTLFEHLVRYFRVRREPVGAPRRIHVRRRYYARCVRRDPLWSVMPDGGYGYPYYPYFVYHYMFDYLLKTDAKFERSWAKTPKMSAIPAHVAQWANRASDAETLSEMSASILGSSPIQKLNWRHQYPAELVLRARMSVS